LFEKCGCKGTKKKQKSKRKANLFWEFALNRTVSEDDAAEIIMAYIDRTA